MPPGRHRAPSPLPGRASSLVDDALKALRKGVRLERVLMVAVGVAAVGIANIPGMYQAATDWKSGVAGTLDKPANQMMREIKADSGKDWIADDQEAFVKAVDEFIIHLEVARKAAEGVGSAVESVGKAYMSYWTAIFNMAICIIPALIFLWILSRIPHTSAAARVAKFALAMSVLTMVISFLSNLQSFLTSVKNIFSMLFAGGAAIQLSHVTPSGSSQIDFKKSTIEWSAPPTFHEPSRATPAPHGN